MRNNVLFIGIDVDDNSFHVGGFNKETKELIQFVTKPTFGALLKKFKALQKKGFKLKVCYEASYIGNNLYRDLKSKNIDCDIIAPSLIPSKTGLRKKTDKLDCLKLAEYFAKDLLTTITVPDIQDEEVRDLIRARGFLIKQRSDLKKHILSTCRRYRINYKKVKPNSNYWTKIHLEWIKQKTKELNGIARKTFEILLFQMEKINDGIEEYDLTINEISDEKRYKKRKEALNCFRGIDTLTAMTLIVEIGDIKRFAHPKQLTSYSGMDISEYSSGGKEKKFGITKMGNKRIRTAIIESCQFPGATIHISKRLKKARKNQDPEIIAIADRCMIRLRKKHYKMFNNKKNINKIKVACAREFLAFIWEALVYVA